MWLEYHNRALRDRPLGHGREAKGRLAARADLGGSDGPDHIRRTP